MLYKEQARYDEAEPLLVEAVTGRRLKLGHTHPHTLESWNNLIELYEASGKQEKADEWRAKLPQRYSRQILLSFSFTFKERNPQKIVLIS